MKKNSIYERFEINLDMVVEAHELIRGTTNSEITGVSMETDSYPHAEVTTIKVLNEAGATNIGKPIGTYITIDAPDVRENTREIHKEIGLLLGNTLREILNLPEDKAVFLAGLGNRHATPDAFGPKVIESCLVTRHLFQYCPEELKGGLRPVSAITPGVLGLTGIESLEIIQGIAAKVTPATIIAIDALAASSLERIATSIQITDTGIHPGSGVGNKRSGINSSTTGCRVIALGIPTVVNAAVIAHHVIEGLFEELKTSPQLYRLYKTITDDMVEHAIKGVFSPFKNNLMVTPKEIDILIERMARITAGGINHALHPGIGPDNFDEYLQ